MASFKLQETFFHLTSEHINASNPGCQFFISQRRSDNILGRLFGVKNTYIEIHGNSSSIKINYDKSIRKVEKKLAPHVCDAWSKQESEVYIPALINKELDIVAARSGKKISLEQKKKIRSIVLKKTYLTEQFKGAENLNSAAQTSIGNVTATHIDKNISLREFFKAENLSRDLQTEIRGAITNKIGDRVYEKIMGQSIHHIRRFVQQEAKKALNPPKKVDIDMSKLILNIELKR